MVTKVRRRENVVEGNDELAKDEKISIKPPFSEDLHPNSFNFYEIFVRIMPLAAYWTPKLTLILTGKLEDQFLASIGTYLSVLLLILSLLLFGPSISELKELFNVRKVSLCPVFAALFAYTSGLVWESVSETACSPFLPVDLPNLGTTSSKYIAPFNVLISSVAFTILIPLAEELAIFSWMYRETVFMVKYGKEEYSSWKDFTNVPLNTWVPFPMLQSCAAAGIFNQENWSKVFVVQMALHFVSSFGGGFVDNIHSQWLYCLLDVCSRILCQKGK